MKPAERRKGALILLLLIISTVLVAAPALAANTVTVSGVIPPIDAPVAEFSGTPNSGNAPHTVQFTDQSTNNPTSWEWKYRKGFGSWSVFSTDQNPAYTFTNPGIYTIRLTAANPGGSDTETKIGYIMVYPHVSPPVAIFTQNKYIGRSPLTVHFTDRSLNEPTRWNWNFGDGGTSTDTNPSHRYRRSGVYIVRLQVSNEAGSSTAYSAVIVL
jgi:PKD repeat protein